MTQRIVLTATLQRVTVIILVLAVVQIVLMKVIQEQAAVPAVIIVQEIHKARVIHQVLAVELHARMAIQTAVLIVTNVLTVTALQAIPTIAGTIATVIVDEAAVGAATTIVGLAALTVHQAVPIALQAAVEVQVTAALLRRADRVNYEM